MSVSFAYRFELYELTNYVFAKKYLHELEAEYQALEEDLYQDAPMVKVVYDSDVGRVYFGSGRSLEDYVIEMIEEKELIMKRLKRMRENEALFSEAFDRLTEKEQEAINAYYFEGKQTLTGGSETLRDAQEKLCSYIGSVKQKERDKLEEKQIEKKKSIRQGIVSGRVRVH